MATSEPKPPTTKGDRPSLLPEPARRGLRWGYWLLGVPAIACLALLVSIGLHLDAPAARRVAEGALNDEVSSLLLGELRVTEVTALSLKQVVIEGAELRDAEGRVVIAAERLTVGIDLWALARSTLSFPKAKAEGVTLSLYEDEAGLPTFLSALGPATPSDGGPSPIDAYLGALEIKGARAHGTLLGLHDLDVHDVVTRMKLTFENDALFIRFSDTSGRAIAPFPFEVALTRADATIDSDPSRGTHLYAAAHVVDSPEEHATVSLHVTATEDARDPEAQALHLWTKLNNVELTRLSQLGFTWAAPLKGPFTGYMHLYDTPSFHIDVWGDTAGGAARVDTNIEEENVTVAARTKGLRLERLVEGAPALRIAGHTTLKVPADGAPSTLHAELEPLEVAGFAIPGTTTEATLHEDKLVISRLEGRRGRAFVTGDGEVDFDGDVRARARFFLPQSHIDPNLKRHLPDIRGQGVSGRVRLQTQGQKISARLEASGNALALPQVSARRFSVRADVTGTLTTPHIKAQGHADDIEVAGYDLAQADISVTGRGQRYAFRLEASRMQQALTASGTLENQAGGVRIDTPVIELQNYGQVWHGYADGLVIGRRGGVTLGDALLVSGGERLQASGGQARDGTLDVHLSAQAVDLKTISAVAQLEQPMRGRLHLNLTVTGSKNEPNVSVEGAVEGASFARLHDITAAYRVALIHHDLTFDGFVDLPDRGTLTTSVTGVLADNEDLLQALRLGAYEVTLEAGGVDIAVVKDLSDVTIDPLRGQLDGRLVLSGSPEAADVSGYLDIANLDLPGLTNTGISTRIAYEDNNLRGRVIVRDAYGGLVEAETNLFVDLLMLAQDPEYALTAVQNLMWQVALRFEPRALGLWPELVREQIPRELWPMELAGDASLTAGGLPARAELHGVLTWPDDALGCDSPTPTHAEFVAVLQNGTSAAIVDVFSAGTRVAQVSAEAPTALDDWLAAAEIPSKVPVEARLGVPGIETLPKDVAALKPQSRPRLDPVNAAVIPGICAVATGPLTLQLAVHDWLGDATTTELRVHSTRLVVQGHALDRLEIGGHTDESRGTAWAESKPFGAPANRISAEVPLRWAPGAPLPKLAAGNHRYVAELGKVPLAALIGWLPQFDDVRGDVSGQTILEGPLDRLSLTGRGLAIRDGYVELAGLGQQLTDVHGRIGFEGDAARLIDLRARDDEGRVALSGRLAFLRAPRGAQSRSPDKAWGQVDLKLTGEKFPVREEGNVLARITGGASLEGMLYPNRTDLTLTLGRDVRVTLPEQSTPSVQSLDAHPDIAVIADTGSSADDGATPEDPFVFIIRAKSPETRRSGVVSRRPFLVQRRDFAAWLAADITVRFEDPELRIRGTVDLGRGFFEVFGKRFDIDRGQMIFDGRPQMNPQVNLVAIHQLPGGGNATVTVTVSGTLNNPEVRFSSSEPVDSQAEVIALLVSGQRSLLTSRQGDANTEQASQQTASFLSGLAAGVLTLTLRQQLGDQVPIIAVDTVNDGQTGRFRAGYDFEQLLPDFIRPVVEGVYLEGQVAGQLGDQQSTSSPVSGRALIEVQFPYNIVTTGQVDTEANWSVDVTWEP